MPKRIELPVTVGDEYLSGASLSQLAVKYGCSSTTVQRLLEDQGIPRRPAEPPPPRRIELPATVSDEYLNGASLSQLAAKYGCSSTTVQKFLEDQGVPRRPAVPKRIELPATIGDEYLSGATLGQLAAKYGCSITTVKDFLEGLGVPRRPAVLPPPRRVDLPTSVIDEYLDGATCKQLGEKYGCSKNKVMYFLHDHDVKMRPKPEAPPPNVRTYAKPKAERLAERVWIEDRTRWPSGGYWVHPDPPEGHGLSAHRNWGCRCKPCCEASSEYQWYVTRGLTKQYRTDRRNKSSGE